MATEGRSFVPWAQGGITKRYEKTSEGDEGIYSLDRDSGFTDLYIFQKLSDCTLEIHAPYCMFILS